MRKNWKGGEDVATVKRHKRNGGEVETEKTLGEGE